MAKQISQETFDAVVKENMEEFEMTVADAIADAVQQFEAQGVILSTIIKDVSHYTSAGSNKKHAVVQHIEDIKNIIEADLMDSTALTDTCAKLEAECNIDLAHRVMAAKNNAYNVIFNAAIKVKADSRTLNAVLKCWCSLCHGQPDVLDLRGISFLTSLLVASETTHENILLTLQLIHFTCIMHEHNRQAFVQNGLITILIGILQVHRSHAAIIKQACQDLRALTLDDDVRVPFGKAHEHAKLIVAETNALQVILGISKEFAEDTSLLGEMFLTLSKLAVRNEFCQEIADLGGLKLILTALEASIDNKIIVIDALKVLKAVAGNDKVKVEIVRAGGMSLILTALSKHQKQPVVCEIGCACVAAIVLRNPEHCKVAMHNNAAEVLVKTLNMHPEHVGAQKQACMAIRNLVARTREYCTEFVNLGVEALLQRTLSKHAECADEAKAALRDLGLNVELKERWTGTGQALHR